MRKQTVIAVTGCLGAGANEESGHARSHFGGRSIPGRSQGGGGAVLGTRAPASRDGGKGSGLLSLAGTVPGGDLQPRNHRHVHDLMAVIRLIDDDFPAGRLEGHEVLMLHREAASVGQMNPKGPERIRVQGFADFHNFHTPTLYRATHGLAMKPFAPGFFRLKAEVTGDKDEKFFLDIKPRFWLGRLG